MTENDYIAEYVKEKWPEILGLDYAIWKMSKVIINFGNSIAEAFKQNPYFDNKNDDFGNTEEAAVEETKAKN